MGCDMTSFVEVKTEGVWTLAPSVFPSIDKENELGPIFNYRSYGMYGFLANVRNYSRVPVIQQPTYRLPDDCCDFIKLYDRDEVHTISFLTLRTLCEFKYDQVFWDRRVTKQTASGNWDCAALANEGEGQHVTIREFLGEMFFIHLEILKTLGDLDNVRVIFWFCE